MKIGDRIALYAILIGVVIGFIILINSFRNDYLLSKNYEVTVGRIVEFGVYSGRTSSAGIFELTVDNKTFRGYLKSQLGCKNLSKRVKSELMGFKIPVVYQPSNPLNNRMLFGPEDYVKFGVEYPKGDLGLILRRHFNCE